MRFEDRPDYVFMRRLFKDLFYREGLTYDFNFDWTAKIHAAASKMPPREHGEEDEVHDLPFGEVEEKDKKSDVGVPQVAAGG